MILSVSVTPKSFVLLAHVPQFYTRRYEYIGKVSVVFPPVNVTSTLPSDFALSFWPTAFLHGSLFRYMDSCMLCLSAMVERENDFQCSCMVIVFLQGCECLQTMTHLPALLELWFIVYSMYIYTEVYIYISIYTQMFSHYRVSSNII